MLPELVSTAELCELFNVQRSTVARWAKAGHLPRLAHGKFSLVAAVRGYAKLVESRADGPAAPFGAGGEVPAKSARTRLSEAQAVAVEMKNAVARGELINEAEVDAAWAEVAVLVRTAVMNAIDRAAADLPHMPRPDVLVFDRRMREALTALRQPEP